jgi:hypothetical protein
MKIVVVYESMFGNTKEVALRIADGLNRTDEVTFGSTDEIDPSTVGDAALIVAGGPTHAHGMPRRKAHHDVAAAPSMKKYGPVLAGELSMREWLDAVPAGSVAVASFDTRFDKPKWLTGSAAKKIAARFETGGHPVVGEESFFVEKTGGPLAPGERERAEEWGKSLAVLLRERASV